MITLSDVIDTNSMIEKNNLDIRTVTLGISLLSCVSDSVSTLSDNIKKKITHYAKNLVKVVKEVEKEYALPIVNVRLSVTPISLIMGEKRDEKDYIKIAKTLDALASEIGVDFIGGYTSLCEKGMTDNDKTLILSLPEVLSTTERVCSSLVVASTRYGINVDAVNLASRMIKETAFKTRDRDSIGCAKLVILTNAPDDNPFMAGAFHGVSEGECTVNVGVSGPGVVKEKVKNAKGKSFDEVCEIIKKTAFKITRLGTLVQDEVAKRLGVEKGSVDLSLAPTSKEGDSVAEILECMGIDKVGSPGSTAALALLNDSVKKGGIMATGNVGGLSGAFIPVSEDNVMIERAKEGKLRIEKLEAMTSVCSVGLDMIALPGSTSSQTLAALILDEASIGVINGKTTGVRLIPVEGKNTGDEAVFGGLLGSAPIMDIGESDSSLFVKRGGHIPPPVHSFKN